MSLHPSLKIDSAGAQQKTVLNRIERIKDLMKKGVWVEGQKVLGLPKTKIVKIKVAKKKKEETEEEGSVEGGAPSEGGEAKAEGGAEKADDAK